MLAKRIETGQPLDGDSGAGRFLAFFEGEIDQSQAARGLWAQDRRPPGTMSDDGLPDTAIDLEVELEGELGLLPLGPSLRSPGRQEDVLGRPVREAGTVDQQPWRECRWPSSLRQDGAS